jgi:hypothetical protein
VGLGLCFFGRFGLFGHRSVFSISSIYFLFWESFPCPHPFMDSLLDPLDAFQILFDIEKSML